MAVRYPRRVSNSVQTPTAAARAPSAPGSQPQGAQAAPNLSVYSNPSQAGSASTSPRMDPSRLSAYSPTTQYDGRWQESTRRLQQLDPSGSRYAAYRPYAGAGAAGDQWAADQVIAPTDPRWMGSSTGDGDQRVRENRYQRPAPQPVTLPGYQESGAPGGPMAYGGQSNVGNYGNMPPSQRPQPFTAQYQNFDGSVSDTPNYAQRDAFIQNINDAMTPYYTGQATGVPQFDLQSMWGKAGDMVNQGWQNPFAMQQPSPPGAYYRQPSSGSYARPDASPLTWTDQQWAEYDANPSPFADSGGYFRKDGKVMRSYGLGGYEELLPGAERDANGNWNNPSPARLSVQDAPSDTYIQPPGSPRAADGGFDPLYGYGSTEGWLAHGAPKSYRPGQAQPIPPQDSGTPYRSQPILTAGLLGWDVNPRNPNARPYTPPTPPLRPDGSPIYVY